MALPLTVTGTSREESRWTVVSPSLTITGRSREEFAWAMAPLWIVIL